MNNCPLLLEAYSTYPDDPSYRAIAGVLDAACAGTLPRFAQWLGLPEQEFWRMLDHSFPGAREEGWTPEVSHNDTSLPCEFQDLVDMLEADRSDDAEGTRWAARALACGCFGGGHLWHDMGLSGREDVSALLQRHFRHLFDANVDNMKWKKFFYHRVCERLDLHPCPEPVCSECDNYAVCYGSETIVAMHHSKS